MNFFRNLRLVTQLVSTFVLVAFIAGMVGLVSYRYIHRIDDADTWLYEKCTVPLGQMSIIASDFNQIRLEVAEAAAAPTLEAAKAHMATVDGLTQEISVNVQGYAKTLIDAEDEANFLKMKASLEAYDRANGRVLELRLAGRDKEAAALVDGPLRQQGADITAFLKKIVAFNERFAKETSDRNTVTALQADRAMGFTIALAVLVSIALGLWVTRVIQQQLGGDPAIAVATVQRIALGDLRTRLDDQTLDPASLLGNIKALAANLEGLATQADTIGRGDFSQEVQPLSAHDRLGHAINDMKDMLRAGRIADERRNWLKDGQSRLALALTGDFPLQELADRAISLIGRHLGAGRGVLYVHRPQEAALDLLGSYMYTERATLGSRYREGEGAIGQVARERRPIILTTAAPGAAPITTGTTCAPPSFTYTYPLLHEGTLLGVLELAASERFDDTRLEYLEAAAAVAASALFLAEQRENIRNLLTATEKAEREARATSEHLAAVNARMEEQQQILQQQAEELQQSNAQMEEQQQQLQQQTEELQQTNMQMEEQQQLLQQQTEELQQTNHQMQEQQDQLEKNNAELRASRAEIDAKAGLLEQSSQYKSEFLANMSHELRTPLNAIILLSKMMADNADGVLEAKTVKRAEVIHRSGRDLLNLINDVLDLSKIEAGRMDLNLAEVESAHLAGEFADTFGSIAQDRGLAFVIEDRLQGAFTTDPDKLAQILRNLLSNAFKFTKEGTVTLVLDRRPGDPLPIHLGVRDTGIGIPAAKQGAIFEAFRQADGSTSREFGGTGLGLTISLRLAQLLGGTLEVHSAPGEGSTFSLRLPDLHPAAAPPRPAQEEAPLADGWADPGDDAALLEPGDQVILVVDDDLRFGRAIVEINRRLGYRTLLAGTGSAGLALARAHHPAGILLDLGLPDMNGADVLHELKSCRELAPIPVYVVSARDRDAAMAGQEIVGYLQKPVDEQQIAQAETALLAVAARPAAGGILVVASGGLGQDEVQRLGAGLGLGPGQARQVAAGEELRQALKEQAWRLAVVDLTGTGVEAGMTVAEGILKARPDTTLLFFGAQTLTDREEANLRLYSDSIIVKAPSASRRLQEDLKRLLRAAPRTPPARNTPPEGLERPLTGRVILVVDDDPRNLFVITAALEQAGATVTNAINGRHALECLGKARVDLIFMDIMMPELDGYETIRLVRADPALAGIPVVALTAKAMPRDRDGTLAAGANDFLSKPVDYHDLVNMAKRWCSKEA